VPSLPRALSRLLLPLAVVAAPLAVTAPASADVTGSTSTDDVVLFSRCQTHQIAYDVLVDPGTLLWRLEVQVVSPRGQLSEGTVINSATNPATSGTVPYTFCGSEEQGTYTVKATGFYQLLPAVQIPFALPMTTFQAKPAATRTSLHEKPLGHGRYRLDSLVKEQDVQGFRNGKGITVRLERLVHGDWKTVRGTALTTVRGRATTTLGGRPGDKVRAVVPARNNLAGSVSRPVTL